MNGIDTVPGYINLLDTGILQKRVSKALNLLSNCVVCPWKCKVNRYENQLGNCKTTAYSKVYSYGPHLGEENPIRGWRGSGTIFFSRCNLHCQYCQNFEISQANRGNEVGSKELASIMLELQHYGCHNINLVSPTHIIPQILEAVLIAAHAGLKIPLVYNTGGYDSLSTLKILDGIVDIYMPDMKYANETTAQRYSKIPHYPQINQLAILEMYRQVGDLRINSRGLATRGLLIRHLVLPNQLSGTNQILHFISNSISKNTYVNIMAQYRPAYRAAKFPELNRRILPSEYQEAVTYARTLGLNRLDCQDRIIEH